MRCAPLLAAGALLLASCTGGLPRVTPELVEAAGRRDPRATPAALENGRAVYVTRCGSCHGLYEPSAYPEAGWMKWMRRMAPKARLDQQQEADVLGYLLAARATVVP